MIVKNLLPQKSRVIYNYCMNRQVATHYNHFSTGMMFSNAKFETTMRNNILIPITWLFVGTNN